jgi:hypothetical protein
MHSDAPLKPLSEAKHLVLVALAMVAFAGNSLLCRVALKGERLMRRVLPAFAWWQVRSR